MSVIEHYLDMGYYVFMDNYYTSVVKQKYGKPNVAIFNSFNFICSFVLCVQLCV